MIVLHPDCIFVSRHHIPFVHPDDQKRLLRERDLFFATRRGGTPHVDEEIRKNKADIAKGRAARSDYIRRARFGYYKDVPESGQYPFREDR